MHNTVGDGLITQSHKGPCEAICGSVTITVVPDLLPDALSDEREVVPRNC
jgi:hypothetical protein